MLAALLITLLLTGCVGDTTDGPVKSPTPDYPFYSKDLIAVKGTKDSSRDFSKILLEYAVSVLDYASFPVWSGKWTIDVIGENISYKTNLKIAHSSEESVISATVSEANSTYSFATVGNSAYYNFNGTKRSYLGNVGGRPLVSSILPVSALSPNQKDDLRDKAWLIIPFSGEITYGTNAGGRVNEYVGTINVTQLLINIAAFSTTGSNSETAGAINKINAMLLSLVNAAFDKDYTVIDKDCDLPQIKAKTHLVTNSNGSTETLKEIYIKPEIDGEEGSLLHIKDFSLSNKKDEFNAKSAIGSTSSYTEMNDEGYRALMSGVRSENLKKTFKFISDYFTELQEMFS